MSRASRLLLLFGGGSQVVYYVDATGGNDANDGKSAATAWQTIGKVNATTLPSGAQVLFKRGETWTLSVALALASGVTYADYGSGAKPILNGADTVNCATAADKTGITLRNLDLRDGLDACALFDTCTNITVTSCDMSGAGNDNLIFIDNCANIAVIGGTYADPYQRVVGTIVTCIEIADGGSNFTIDGVTCSGSPAAGISVHNHSASDPQGSTNIPTNVTIRNSTLTSNTLYGINLLANDPTNPTTVTIEDCSLTSNGSGFYVQKRSGSAGYVNGAITLRRCTLANNTTYGWFVQGDNVSFEYCLTYGTTQQNRFSDAQNGAVTHCTIYLNPASALFPLQAIGTRTNTITVRNTIIHSASTSGQVIGTGAGATTGVTVDWTKYFFPNTASARWLWNNTAYTYVNWRTNSGQDAHSLTSNTADTLFVNVAGGDFHLQAGSPAIGAASDGTNIGAY
jgi:hypothetical protein